MAFFKFRKTADDCASAPPATQSIETLRQRAKYRLLGASVLVLIGVIGFPLLFDKQPRPIAVDTPIDIPDRNKVATLQLATVGAPAAPVASAASVPLEAASVATAVAAAPVASTAELIAVPASQPAASAETAEAASASKDSSAKLSPLPANKASLASNGGPSEAANSAALAASAASIKSTDATARVAEAARAQALLEGKSVEAVSSADHRFVVQVGAFADDGRAQEVRHKLERVGLKTYTHVAEIKGVKRIRVRVGPFATKAEADKAAEKIRKINLPAAVLTLTR